MAKLRSPWGPQQWR